MVLNSIQTRLSENFTVQAGKGSYLELMENAGYQAYLTVLEQFKDRDITELGCLILVGSGNNGGDALVVARLLRQSGVNATILLCGQFSIPTTKQSLVNYHILFKTDIPILKLDENPSLFELLTKADIIIDGVFGIGFRGQLSEKLQSLFRLCNHTSAYKLALDIPSGINCDDGTCSPDCFNATQTIAFSTLKPVHVAEQAKQRIGEVIVCDIGIPHAIILKAFNYPTDITYELVKGIVPSRGKNSHKGDYGKLLNVSGSVGMSGAAMMSTLSALRSGVGITCLASVSAVTSMIAPHIMEAMTLPLPEKDGVICYNDSIKILQKEINKYSALIIGCGLSNAENITFLVSHLLREYDKKIILDADGINSISGNINVLSESNADVIITPHPAELSRICHKSVEFIQSNRIAVARIVATQFGITVVLKGTDTIIALKDGRIFVNHTGNAGLAKGGSGDVLSGMIGSFLAMGLSCEHAAICGVYMHGRTADIVSQRYGLHSILARDIIDTIPMAFKELE